MRRAAAIAALFLLAACGSGSGGAKAEGARAGDVRLAARYLRESHPNLFHDLAPARFERTVDELAAPTRSRTTSCWSA